MKGSQILRFTDNEVIKTKGDANFTNVLSGVETNVTYTSSNPSVATVNASGEITIINSGTTTITATAHETALYYGTTASYGVTVHKGKVNLDKNEVTTFEANFADLEGVHITVGGNRTTLTRDGKYLTGYAGYTFNNGRIGEVVSGSVKVTLYKEFLATLPVGEYFLGITTTGGITAGTVEGRIQAKSTNGIIILNGGTGATVNTTAQTGEVVTVTAGTRAGYTFKNWTATGGVTVKNNEFVMLNEDVTLTANWTRNNTSGNDGLLSSGGGASSSGVDSSRTYHVEVQFGSGDGKYKAGEWVTITAEVRDGKTFSHWVSDEVTFENENASTTRFIMNNKDVTVTAVYVGEHSNPQTGNNKYSTSCRKRNHEKQANKSKTNSMYRS